MAWTKTRIGDDVAKAMQMDDEAIWAIKGDLSWGERTVAIPLSVGTKAAVMPHGLDRLQVYLQHGSGGMVFDVRRDGKAPLGMDRDGRSWGVDERFGWLVRESEEPLALAVKDLWPKLVEYMEEHAEDMRAVSGKVAATTLLAAREMEVALVKRLAKVRRSKVKAERHLDKLLKTTSRRPGPTLPRHDVDDRVLRGMREEHGPEGDAIWEGIARRPVFAG